ncbi:unnamed protein product [Leptosia nina]|uniref:PiggyBac transposable element-derived protein domain-containing protein n=1 Tax=Leptosia nina TaxID=320188 RepID=A0AAV1JYM7_9NEOP
MSSKAANNKKMKKLTPEKRQAFVRLNNAKQVGNYELPDTVTSNGKGKGKSTEPDHRIPCPGVPSTPPPRIPQPWEKLLCDETIKKDIDDDVIKGTTRSPGLTKARRRKRVQDMEMDKTPTASRAKSRKRDIKLSSPTGNQVKERPSTPLGDIEFQNYTLTSSILAKALGSGRSAKSKNSLENDVEIERNMGSEASSGSEMDVEEENLLKNAIAKDLDEPNPTEAVELMRLDAEEDQAIRGMVESDADVLNFDWSSKYKNFEGVREAFSGPSGPTFNTSGMSPLRVFEQIWNTSIIDHIVTETNNYARQLQDQRAQKRSSRISRWKEATREEIWRFLSILMLQSLVVNNVEKEYWYPSNDHLRIGNFNKIMTHNRFLLIKRCLHFIDNSSLPARPSKLDKIMPVIAHLNDKFSTLYLPEQNLAIDESLLLWQGRLSFAQKIATKRAREGIKSYEICESRTGYLWKMEIYTGKRHLYAPQEACPVPIEGQKAEHRLNNATSQIVLNLMRPLLGKGHTLVMDNYYNSPLLSRLLKAKHRTDTMGTLRLSREFIPEGLKTKTKKNMKSGEVCFSSTKDICVLVYMDKNIVPMISTFHPPEVGGKSKYGYYKYKPKVIADYNLSMGGIDQKDQLLSSYPIERNRNLSWYKKLFRRLLNVSIHNASVIYNHGRTGSHKLVNRSFRLQLLTEMLKKYSPDTPQTPQQPQPPPSQMHLPVKVKTQRCRLCYRNKVRRTTVWRCGTCQVNLCIDGCYAVHHRDLESESL